MNFSESASPPGSQLPNDNKTLTNPPIGPEPSPSYHGPSDEVGEQIRFHYSFADLDEESPTDEAYDDDRDGNFLALVVRLDNGHFQTLEPVSMTPFGPYGPSLDLGVVFEAEPLDDGTFRYVRTVEQPRAWQRTIGVSQQVLNQDAVRPILNQASQLGGKW